VRLPLQCDPRQLPPAMYCQQDALLDQFDGLNCWLVAENGVFMRPPPSPADKAPVRKWPCYHVCSAVIIAAHCACMWVSLKKPGVEPASPSKRRSLHMSEVLTSIPSAVPSSQPAQRYRRRVLQDWVSLVDVKKTDWMESVRLVFDYFCERTPRSFVESREASIVWNYKCAHIEQQGAMTRGCSNWSNTRHVPPCSLTHQTANLFRHCMLEVTAALWCACRFAGSASPWLGSFAAAVRLGCCRRDVHINEGL